MPGKHAEVAIASRYLHFIRPLADHQLLWSHDFELERISHLVVGRRSLVVGKIPEPPFVGFDQRLGQRPTTALTPPPSISLPLARLRQSSPSYKTPAQGCRRVYP